jgi:hypothetical protein
MATFTFFAPITRIGYFALLLGSTQLLASCAKDPENAGKKLADAYCEAVNKHDAPRYEAQEKLVSELESGKITTYSQFNARQKELMKDILLNDSTDTAHFKSLITQNEVDFPKEEDRTTMRNAFQAHGKQCDEERIAKNKNRKDLLPQIQQLKNKLAFK